MQYIDKVADIPVDEQRRGSTVQAAQHIDEVEDIPAFAQSEVQDIPDDDEDRLKQKARGGRFPRQLTQSPKVAQTNWTLIDSTTWSCHLLKERPSS